MDVRVFATRTLLQATATPDATVRFRPCRALRLRVLARTAGSSTARAYLTGVSQRVPLRDGDGEDRSREQHRDRVLPSDPARRRRPDRLPFHRPTACVPTRITGTPIKDAAPITFLGERLAEEKPVVQSWIVGSPADIPWETMPKKDGVYRLAGGLKSESFYPIVQGYKDSPAVGMRWNLSDPLQLNRLSVSASYSPDTGLPGDERVAPAGAVPALRLARRRAAGTTRTSTICSGRPRPAARDTASSVGRKWTLIYDDPRRLELDVDGAYSGNLDRLPDYQNVPVDVNDLVTINANAGLQRRPQLAGPRRRGNGHQVGRHRAGLRRRRQVHPADARRLCVRSRAADRALVGLVPPVGGLLAARPRSAVCQLLLRRLRQQLRRPRRREALPRVLQLRRRGAERDRRPQLREVARSNGTCRRGASRGWGRRGSTRRGCGRRSS